MARRRHTGEKQAKRQPLKLDKLPQAWLEWIQEGRALGLTWDELENSSREGIGYTRGARKQLLSWDKTPEAVKLFPQKTLPATTMHRWYDLRVEQVQKETMAQATRAREFAAAFAGKSTEGLDGALVNAMRDQVFMLMEASDSGSRDKLLSALGSLLFLVTKRQELEVKKGKLELERKKLDQVRSKIAGLKDDVAKKKQLDPKQLQHKLDEIYGITQG